ncbi:MAG: sulfotransferase domain-containing protein, partial [Geminicoccaceae bacterium]|nr:sulfotransferase domain-containing protein [Geminicoccaceae bacterium]
AWIMDSIERLTRGQPFERSRLWSDAERSSVFTRCEALAKSDRLVGSSWCGLREALASEYRGRILLVEYDDLARDPAGQMERIYLHIGEQPFGHDFDNVDYAEPEFDAQLSTPGLHTVKRRVERIERKTILPDELFRKFDSLSAWRAPP